MAEEARSPRVARRAATVEALPAGLDAPLLEVEVRHLSSRRVRVAFTGVLNRDSATMARQVFDDATTAGYTEVEVDVGALSLGDVEGLDVLESAQVECAEHGGLLLLVSAPLMLRRILDVTGLNSLLVGH
jgi:anti-anti-sigma factor